MDVPGHYSESERLLAMSTDSDGNPPADPEDSASLTPYLRAAQVHATLALAADRDESELPDGVTPKMRDLISREVVFTFESNSTIDIEEADVLPHLPAFLAAVLRGVR